MVEVCRSKFGGLGILQTRRGREAGVLICFLNAHLARTRKVVTLR